MDEFLAEIALMRLKPTEWQFLIYLIAKRNTEPQASLKPIGRSVDATWRGTKSLADRGWIEPVPDTQHGLWRITDELRQRLDGPQAKPAPAVVPSVQEAPKSEDRSFSSDPPPARPADERSFSTEPKEPQTERQPERPEPVIPGFLGRSPEIQRAALRVWKRSMLRQDLFAHVFERMQNPHYVHPDLDEALETAERWALKVMPREASDA